MPDKKYVLIAVAALIGVVGIVVAWNSYSRQADAAMTEAAILKEVSADDISAILKSQAEAGDENIAAISESHESRKAFVQGLREHLALAAQARREGLASDPLFLINYEAKKDQLLADLYQAKLGHDLNKPYPVTEEESTAVWASAENKKAFQRDMDAMRQIQSSVNEMLGTQMAPGVLMGESLERAKRKWARTKIVSDKAKADADFMASKEVQLRMKVLEAGLLSSDLLRKHWRDRIKATDAEIKAFIAKNPEYDLNRKVILAQNIHQRVLNGENFNKLVAEHSEHRPTKATGGLFEEMMQGDMPEPLEAALLAAEPGQMIGHIVATDMGWHIAKLERKTPIRLDNGREVFRYSFRQILIQNKFEQPGVADPNIPPPFMTAEEIVRAQIEKDKRDGFVAEYLEKNKISMPEDFAAQS